MMVEEIIGEANLVSSTVPKKPHLSVVNYCI